MFQWVAAEIFRFATGRRPLREGRLEYRELRQRQKVERARLRRIEASSAVVRGFWRDYLIGRDGTFGMELVTETRSFKDLMGLQVEALDSHPGHTVVDLGSGVGSFARFMAGSVSESDGPKIVEVDFVFDALARSRAGSPEFGDGRRAWISADLCPADAGLELPLKKSVADRVLLSLVLNYVRDPVRVLRAAKRVLRADGLLVLSALRKDADTSQICVDGVAELREGRALSAFGEEGEAAAASALGAFINDAGRLLDLEEQGVFKFWDESELADLLTEAGLEASSISPAFGDPPQAWLVVARHAVECTEA